MWELGLLEHVMHAHATYVARAVNPETNFVAAPPGAFELEEDPDAAKAVRSLVRAASRRGTRRRLKTKRIGAHAT